MAPKLKWVTCANCRGKKTVGCGHSGKTGPHDATETTGLNRRRFQKDTTRHYQCPGPQSCEACRGDGKIQVFG